jgi:phosphohistidine phosphatase
MNLYLVRHAEALPVGSGITRDADRPLSPRGETDAAMMGRVLSRIEPGISAILCSPLTRAVQTGTLCAAGFDPRPHVKPSDALLPGFRFASLLQELTTIGRDAKVVAIGHQPDLTNFMSYLVADAATEIGMPPGAVARLTLHPTGTHPEAILNWLLTPELVQSLLATR